MSSAVECAKADLGIVAEAKHWFAVFTLARHEKRVEQHFRLREMESFLPLYWAQRRWKDGSKKILQLPLFPSYIFVRIGHSTRQTVLGVPGVIALVGSERKGLPIPDSYICSLQQGLQQGKIEPHPDPAKGTRVRIRSGVMAGLVGTLVSTKSSCRVLLTLEMIMRSITVEVELGCIEPIG